MNTNSIQLRFAEPKDSQGILALVKELAIFEKAENAVKTKPEDYEQGIKTGLFHTLLAMHPTEGIIGMALYFPYFSTWGGQTMYLEDFIVKESFRRSGVGTLLFEAFIQDARKRGARKLKWQVLDWNETAKSFYKKYDAQFITGWETGVIEFEE